MDKYTMTEQSYKNGYEAGLRDASNKPQEKISVVKIIAWIVMKFLFICLISGTLGLSGISFTDWQFWTIMSGACGFFLCGMLLS